MESNLEILFPPLFKEMMDLEMVIIMTQNWFHKWKCAIKAIPSDMMINILISGWIWMDYPTLVSILSENWHDGYKAAGLPCHSQPEYAVCREQCHWCWFLHCGTGSGMSYWLLLREGYKLAQCKASLKNIIITVTIHVELFADNYF